MIDEDDFRRDGVFKATQTTTRNLSFAVSDCFWKMVKESVEQQADTFKAKRFNLETEWKNSFPKIREQDRVRSIDCFFFFLFNIHFCFSFQDELFEKARGEILDEVVTLSQIPSRQWEENLSKHLWSAMSDYVFNDVFPAAVQAESIGYGISSTVCLSDRRDSLSSGFNTTVDVKLQQWAEKVLPRQCIQIGHQVLLEEFQMLIEREQNSRSYDPIANDLKMQVVQACRSRHQWDTKALDLLVWPSFVRL